jgi:S-adenosylmethionine synthetase
MDLLLASLEASRGDTAAVEVVERKGLGHPDTICDALVEELSIALSRFYLDRFETILHHNVDKALLWGGRSAPAFGGGEVLEPFEVFLAGRAVERYRGVQIPIQELAAESGGSWLRTHLRLPDLTRPPRLHSLVRPGSPDLMDIFQRRRPGSSPANDTSCGVGYAPASRLERAVLSVERRLNSPAVREGFPYVGSDVKVLGVRRGHAIDLTVACAMVDAHVQDLGQYRECREQVANLVREAALEVADMELAVAVNAGDDLEKGNVYLTVTGTSAEMGDDGSAGRGNRFGGLITPGRPMTMESVAGKNPVTHVGKVYNVLAHLIAEDLVRQVSAVTGAECCLVSRIGHRLQDPQLVQVKLAGERSPEHFREEVANVVNRHLAAADGLWHQLLERTYPIY